MLKREDRIRIDHRVKADGYNYPVYIYLCIKCNEEIWKVARDLKKSTGFCKKCYLDMRKSKEKLVSNNGFKNCNICKQDLPVSEFRITVNETYNSSCKSCHYLHRYGLTCLQYENILINQNFKCAICKKEETQISHINGKILPLAVDHNHNDGKVRGLLCGKCNKAIGLLKDDISILENAIEYLKREIK